MDNPQRPILQLSSRDAVPADEDARVEIAIYDTLLPCRRFEIGYKVAVLGSVSPSLEFLLRLVRTVPGISEEAVALFFGYSSTEMAYVLNEALGPGYVERRDARLWLTEPGDSLFRNGDGAPSIFTVEDRHRSVGFDLMAVAPQSPKSLDSLELCLPELPISANAGTGSVGDRIGERFGRFFHELGDRADRERVERRDLYSIDSVVPGDRFQAPVRVRVFSQASAPSLPDNVDLSAWRPDHEVAERPAVEASAAMLIDELRVTANQLDAAGGYAFLSEAAPEFLKDFLTRNGLSATRYWREAVSRAGEVRKDRPTIPIVGPLYTEENAKRFLEVVGYGLTDKNQRHPEFIFWMAPQTRHWGATTQQRDTLTALKRHIQSRTSSEQAGSVCLFAGKAPRYVERSFDYVHGANSTDLAPSVELLLVPNVAAAVVIHAPILVASGQPVPLGVASFDARVVGRIQSLLEQQVARFVLDVEQQKRYSAALSRAQPDEALD